MYLWLFATSRVKNIFNTAEVGTHDKQRAAPGPQKGDFKAWICSCAFGLQGGPSYPWPPLQSRLYQQLLSRISLICILKLPAKDQPTYVSNTVQLSSKGSAVMWSWSDFTFFFFCSFNINHVQLECEYLRVCRVIVSFNGTIMYTQFDRNRIWASEESK